MTTRPNKRIGLITQSAIAQSAITQSVYRLIIGMLIGSVNFFIVDQELNAQSVEQTSPAIAESLSTPQKPVGLKDVVKIIIERDSNRIRLVGSPEDVAIVIRTLNSINSSLISIADPIVSEKVILKSQLADTVFSIMSNSIGIHNPAGPDVKISAVHFPEAILIVGAASAVKRAKVLLANIDCY